MQQNINTYVEKYKHLFRKYKHLCRKHINTYVAK